LTQEERYQICALPKDGFSHSAIAKNIGKHISSIIRRCNIINGKGYRPRQAQVLANIRESSKLKYKRLTEIHIEYIKEKIKLD
jgi:IS30 family transposase